MDPAVAAVLGPDNVQFEKMLLLLLSTSNAERGEAERVFNLCKEQPDALVLKLLSAMQTASDPNLRTIGSVLLRRVLTKEAVSLWPQLRPELQGKVKQDLLQCVQQEQVKSISKKVCDIVAELAAVVVEEGGWPELMPFMFQCVTAGDDRLKEASLLIFGQLAHYLQEPLKPHLKTLHDVFLHSLSTATSTDVRLAALRASANFVQTLETPEELTQFQDLLPGMMKTISLALESKDEATAQDALEMLIEIAGLEPRYLRKQLEEVVSSMLHIAELADLEDSTRHLAIEFLITLAEARERAPGMMRKVPHVVGRLFAVLLGMLLDVEDAPEWFSADSEDDTSGEGENFEVAQECLDRLSISVGGNTVLPVASQLLHPFASDPDWKKRHAAHICLAQIAEGCAKVMIKNLSPVVDMLLAACNDPHPRVRWAAINAIGQLSTDLGPDLQEGFHAKILPTLIRVMDDASNPRVQAHATAAVLNFAEAATPEILSPYLPELLTKLMFLLQTGKRMVQEGALTAIAAVADCSQEHFTQFYDGIIPLLKEVLVKASDKDSRMLRAKAMECISLIGMAVGKDKFRDDAKQVMDVLLKLQNSPLESDDPTMSYMLQAWARLCKCLGQEFLPYMQVVMPPLLHSASLKPDVTVTDVEEAEEDEEDESVETITIGDKRIGIRTSMLEEKATACNMLCCYADELKEGFFPWIESVAQLMVPLFKFYFHEEVRKAAVQCVPELLLDGKLAVEKGLAPAVVNGLPYLKQLSNFLIPPLVDVLSKEPEVEMVAIMLEALQESIQVVGQLLEAGEVRGILQQLKEVMDGSRQRRKERAERAKGEDFDEEEGEILEEENEAEDEVYDQVGEVVAELIKTFKASFAPFFDELVPLVLNMMEKQNSTAEQRVGICIFDDVAEHFGDAGHKYFDTFVPRLLDACYSDQSEIRQAAVYGIGVCAQFGGAAFAKYAAEAVARLGAVVQAPTSRSEENVAATDNAVSSLGKLCEFQAASGGFDSAAVLAAWLDYLPLKEDKVEAKAVHAQLCTWLERSDARILGPNNQNLPKVTSVLVQVIQSGTELAEEETRKRIVVLLASLPADVISSLPLDHQMAIKSTLSS